MAWQLKGQLIESCSCNMFCPCWFGVQELMVMDQGWCAGVVGFRIEEGSSGGTNLGGRVVAFTVYFPGPTLFDGNATARLFFDDGTDGDQQSEGRDKGGRRGDHRLGGGWWRDALTAPA